MKRKLQKDEIGARLHLGDEVKRELNVQKRSVAWLAAEIDHDPSNLSDKLNSPYIHNRWLYEISRALKRDFFSLYTKYLVDEK